MAKRKLASFDDAEDGSSPAPADTNRIDADGGIRPPPPPDHDDPPCPFPAEGCAQVDVLPNTPDIDILTTPNAGAGSGGGRRSMYDVRERVLARDQDGILYFGHIRRKMYGMNHQASSISVLNIFDLSVEDVVAAKSKGKGGNNKGRGGDQEGNAGGDDDGTSVDGGQPSPQPPGWFYFVHFEGWKVNWDRWVLEDDIMEATPTNVDRMNVISSAHRSLQREVKDRSKDRKIRDAGLFMKLWKQQLDGLYGEWGKLDNLSLPPPVVGGRAASVAAGGNKDPRAKKRHSKGGDSTTGPKNGRGKAKSEEEAVKDQAKLAVRARLTIREAAHVQAIPLAFGLKRVLVEDWEILNAASREGGAGEFGGRTNVVGTMGTSGMVHCLPAGVTIRDALTVYLKEKGVVWDGISAERRLRRNKSTTIGAHANSSPPPGDGELRTETETEPTPMDSDSPKARSTIAQTSANCGAVDKGKEFLAAESGPIDFDAQEPFAGINDKVVKDETDNTEDFMIDDQATESSKMTEPVAENSSSSPASTSLETTEQSELERQWTDMADGISIYFEQALPTRLLYPSEVAQYVLLIDATSKDPMDIYGCEHLLRLLSVMPRILEQRLNDSKLKRMPKLGTCTDVLPEERKSIEPGDDHNGGDNDFAERGGVILAKLQDLARFLQKNQSTLFCSKYRKMNEDEAKQESRIQKRQERLLKKKADIVSLQCMSLMASHEDKS